jgi:hypothetical protein
MGELSPEFSDRLSPRAGYLVVGSCRIFTRVPVTV